MATHIMREPNSMDRVIYTIVLFLTLVVVLVGTVLLLLGQTSAGTSILSASGTMFIFIVLSGFLIKPWKACNEETTPETYDSPPPYRDSWGKSYRRKIQSIGDRVTDRYSNAEPVYDNGTPIESSCTTPDDQQAPQQQPSEAMQGATSVYIIDSPSTQPQQHHHHLPSTSQDSLASVHSSGCHSLQNTVSAHLMYQKTALPFPSTRENTHIQRSYRKTSVRSSSESSEEELPPPYSEAMRAWRAGVAGGGILDAKYLRNFS
ncbi:uncharacterized protein LOC143029898 isoform X2 [Oratosquilla oratoria]|uniref:uncharacterized protein LOC143029898 isoform X2 n=1 Tax=Oratosquilla oratoria TaxID=337810 RepID=UPI003F76F5AC